MKRTDELLTRNEDTLAYTVYTGDRGEASEVCEGFEDSVEKLEDEMRSNEDTKDCQLTGDLTLLAVCALKGLAGTWSFVFSALPEPMKSCSTCIQPTACSM